MKKAFICFLLLFAIFITTWTVKYKTPSARPDSYANGLLGLGDWWLRTVSAEEVDSVWKLDPEIPSNYLPVPGEDELYMVIDEEGHIIKYRHRTRQEDGSWLWSDVNPDIPKNYEAVDGLENVYRVTDEHGYVKYYRYVRNFDNDTYAFVEVDENGNDVEIQTPSGSDIPANFVHMGNNVYAILNDHGVVIGYKERYIDDAGNYLWRDASKPDIDSSSILNMDYSQWLAGAGSLDTAGGASLGSSIVTVPEVVVVQPEITGGPDMPMNDGTYTETETMYSTEKSGGYLITYKTVVQRVYSANGDLMMTRSEGPTEVSREAAQSVGAHGSADPSKIAKSLSDEVARVTVGISFKDSLANELLALINASRAKDGLAPVTMGGDSQRLAKARAAAMAEYDGADYKNPLYGDLVAMLDRFGMSGIPSENTWKTASSRGANEIHSRFMGTTGSRDAIMSPLYTEVGIGIAVKNGYLYISEVFYK